MLQIDSYKLLRTQFWLRHQRIN